MGISGGRGKWMALTAALLGWMFDGLEMGLFPLVARPALRELYTPPDQASPGLALGVLGGQALVNFQREAAVGLWFSVATAGFLVGAATGGVLFGWLGDRIGRVRAMTLSVLTYALVSGLCGIASAPWQVAILRSLAALGMGGEWALGVALVMEVWPNRSRVLLAGLIGAAANLGYMLVAVVDLTLRLVSDERLSGGLETIGLPSAWAAALVGHSRWRLLMLLGALPALLTFFIRVFVPESERWQEEQKRGATSHWATRDLLGVLIGSLAGAGMIYLWAAKFDTLPRLAGTAIALLIITAGYLYPIIRYQQRLGGQSVGVWTPTVKRMLLGACISGVALIGTWASIQWAPVWADKLYGKVLPGAKSYTQFSAAFGAIVGTILGAMLGDWVGRRFAYFLLCVGSLGATWLFYRGNSTDAEFGVMFVATAFLAGALTASFYGWLPLYLPELFSTNVRATGQGFSFNFGRNLAAIAALQTSVLHEYYKQDYAKACSVMSLIYLVGVVIIWFAPETRGQPLPE